MKLEATEFLRQLDILKMQAESVLLSAKVLEESLKGAIRAELPPVPVGPVSGQENSGTCLCPPSKRFNTATSGHPTRTQCKICKKEFE